MGVLVKMKAEKDKGKDEGSNVEVNKDKEIKVGG